MSIASAKVPVAVVAGTICLLLGIAGGIFIGPFVHFDTKPQDASGAEAAPDAKDTSKNGPPGGGMGMPKGGMGMPKGGGGGAPKGPNPKQQLTQLVTKLETLSKKPLAVELTADQKKDVKAILADLDAKDALSEDDAKAKLEQLLKLLESQKATLQAAGYLWPGTPFPKGGDAPSNPFKEGDGAAKLNSLRDSLGK